MDKHEEYMRIALAEARAAADEREIPVGAVVVKDGEIIARAHNEKERRKCALAHAEMLALERAAAVVGDWRLSGADMYVTMEPCAMCAGALINSRVDNLYFGTPDVRFGACGSVYNILEDAKLNHSVKVYGGILEQEALGLLQDFFKKLRMK